MKDIENKIIEVIKESYGPDVDIMDLNVSFKVTSKIEIGGVGFAAGEGVKKAVKVGKKRGPKPGNKSPAKGKKRGPKPGPRGPRKFKEIIPGAGSDPLY